MNINQTSSKNVHGQRSSCMKNTKLQGVYSLIGSVAMLSGFTQMTLVWNPSFAGGFGGGKCDLYFENK